MRVYWRSLDGNEEQAVHNSLVNDLMRMAKIIGVEKVVEALVRLGAITFIVNNYGVSTAAWYSIMVDEEKLMFAGPQELLRKLDDLGVFGD